MAAAPELVDRAGRPLRRSAEAFTAGSAALPETADWSPRLGSADADLLPERETIAARIHDLARNDGWAANGLQRNLDNVIGAGLRLSHRPDWRALGISAEEAAAVARQVEAKWRGFADDPDCWCDAARQQTMAGLFGLAYRHWLIDGEALALPLWRAGRGGAWATAFQIVDPARLSNPNEAADTEFLRGGVELDGFGAPAAYHVRAAHPGEWWGMAVANRYRWERIPRFTAWGRRRVVHFYEKERAGQTRGKSRITPIVKKLRMVGRYDELELQAAVANALLAAFIESPFEHEALVDMLTQGQIDPYQQARADYWKDKRRVLGRSGMQITTLFPGEQLSFPAAARPHAAFDAFESAALRNIAGAFGLSYEQFSQDWSKVNYSSARGALLEVWRGLTSRRAAFANGVASVFFALWLEEAMDRGEIDLPVGAPGFGQAKAAWSRCRWIGPGRGWIDPVKEAQAAQMRMEAGLSTLEAECAEQGLDWEEVIEQRAIEQAALLAAALPRPVWADMPAPKPDPADDRRPGE